MGTELCFPTSRPVVSDVAAEAVLAVAAILLLVLAPLGYVSVRLQRQWLLCVYTISMFVASILLFIAAVLSFVLLEGGRLSGRVDDAWAGLTLSERRLFGNTKDNLRDEMHDDALALG